VEIRIGSKRDRVFMQMAYCVAQLSKDKSTHIGAIIVGPDHEVRSVGYNSFPRGVNDNVPERQQRPLKYFWFAHAEANAVYNAANIGIPLHGCRIYTNGTPCDRCATAIIGAGIKEVIIDLDWEERFEKLGITEWEQSIGIAKQMFFEADVAVWAIESMKVHVPRLVRGEYIPE